MSDVPFDSSDPKAVKEQAKASKSKEDVALEGLRMALSTEPGRAWLYRALTWTSVGHNPFNRDPIMMAFSCGEHNIGQQMMSDMQTVSFELYMLMLKENDK
jgi:hypothetical protein